VIALRIFFCVSFFALAERKKRNTDKSVAPLEPSAKQSGREIVREEPIWRNRKRPTVLVERLSCGMRAERTGQER